MKYLGGKQKIGKKIASIINMFEPKSYCEPFCGMLGVGRHVKAKRKVFCDAHPDLIALHRALQNGWIPPKCVSPDTHKHLRHDTTSALRGFVGFGCSFGGAWFGGYAKEGSRNPHYDISSASARQAEKLRQALIGAEIYHCCYKESPNDVDIIYCDPPYAGRYGYKGVSFGFDSDEFWLWARQRSKDCLVFVSEYTAPTDFVKIWSKDLAANMFTSVASHTKNKRTDNVFVHESQSCCVMGLLG